ncbi:MAG: SDR family NAD(P)-dependent oxidoreductase [bacterium]|nr:SDR family NAD(P)-dependent oxidoreductase [bacterium]
METGKILITGGAGFIGSHVAEALLKQGENIVIIDDFNDYYNPAWKRENIKEIKKHAAVYEADIRDEQALDTIFKKEKFGSIIHLAARAGVRPSIKDPILYQEVNIGGTHNVLEAARKHDIQNLILSSSSSVYGNQKKTLFSEDDRVDNPISPYAATKRAMELLAHVYYHLWGLNIACLRFFTVYGERGRPDMAPYLFTEKILRGEEIQKFGDGTSRRDYTYVGDIVEGIVRCLDKKFGYEIINLGNNNPISLNKFIETLEEITGKKAKIQEMPMQEGDVEVTYADISKAKKILGWEPHVSFEEGIKRFVEWYKAERM